MIIETKQTHSNFLSRFWLHYHHFMARKINNAVPVQNDDINSWRSVLFTNFMVFLFPVCLLALVPGVLVGLKLGYYFIGGFDIFIFIALVGVVLNSSITIVFKKVLSVSTLYCLALVLLIYLGLFGPGMLYLLALSIFVSLFFSKNYAFFSVFLNIVLSVGCALIIQFNLFNSPLNKQYDVGAWIAVSSNLVFLSFVIVVLINTTISMLEKTIIKGEEIKNELLLEAAKRALSNSLLKESEAQYKILFSQSPSPMWVIDRLTLRFLQINDVAIQQYGYSGDDFLTLSINDIKLARDVGPFPGSQLPYKTQHRRKNKEVFDVEVTYNFIEYNGNLALLMTARDITEGINHTKKIVDQNAKLREIAYIQSHFVRAPLARILGLVDIITNNPAEATDPNLLNYLTMSAQDLDDVIQKITNKTFEL